MTMDRWIQALSVERERWGKKGIFASKGMAYGKGPQYSYAVHVDLGEYIFHVSMFCCDQTKAGKMQTNRYMYLDLMEENKDKYLFYYVAILNHFLFCNSQLILNTVPTFYSKEIC